MYSYKLGTIWYNILNNVLNKNETVFLYLLRKKENSQD